MAGSMPLLNNYCQNMTLLISLNLSAHTQSLCFVCPMAIQACRAMRSNWEGQAHIGKRFWVNPYCTHTHYAETPVTSVRHTIIHTSRLCVHEAPSKCYTDLHSSPTVIVLDENTYVDCPQAKIAVAWRIHVVLCSTIC